MSERRPEVTGAADAGVPVPDRELMRRVRLGDHAAFEALVQRHIKPAVRLASRLLGDDAEAEDVVQESFVAVIEQAETFDPSRSFAPWFYRIVANRTANARRTQSRKRAERLAPSLATSRPGPERDAERGALRERLRSALAKLPDRQREILLLYDVDGFTGPEIAEMLDIAPATVRWHLHQARAAMRAILTEEEDG